MNFVKKYQINDTLDRLIGKYGANWDEVVPNSDPDWGRIKNFRTALHARDESIRRGRKSSLVVMHDKVTNRVQVFDSVEDIAKLLSITRYRVYQAIQKQATIKHRFRVKYQAQYLEDGGF